MRAGGIRSLAVVLSLALALSALVPTSGYAQELTASAGEDDSDSENLTLVLLGVVVVIALVVAWRVDAAGKEQAALRARTLLAMNESESLALKLDGFKLPDAVGRGEDEYVTGVALRAAF